MTDYSHDLKVSHLRKKNPKQWFSEMAKSRTGPCPPRPTEKSHRLALAVVTWYHACAEDMLVSGTSGPPDRVQLFI